MGFADKHLILANSFHNSKNQFTAIKILFCYEQFSKRAQQFSNRQKLRTFFIIQLIRPLKKSPL